MTDAAPKVVVMYVYPALGGDHDVLAAKFASTYMRYRPTTPHELRVVANGGSPTPKMLETFRNVRAVWLEHDDSGWDIGAYRKAAREVPCDLMVFFGGSAYLRGTRWLERMIEAWKKHGRAIYGSMGSLAHNPHIRTTGFWMPPDLLNAYPHPTTSEKVSRYAFEHGRNGLTMWVLSQNLKAWVVTWTAEYEHPQWNTIPNGYHRGDQSALITGDRLIDPPYYRRTARPVLAQPVLTRTRPR